MKTQLKTSLLCPCLLIVFFPFLPPFAAVFKLSCVRVQLARIDVREKRVVLCCVLECFFALQPPSPFTAGDYRMLATDLRNSRIHPHAQKPFQKKIMHKAVKKKLLFQSQSHAAVLAWNRGTTRTFLVFACGTEQQSQRQ